MHDIALHAAANESVSFLGLSRSVHRPRAIILVACFILMTPGTCDIDFRMSMTVHGKVSEYG